MARIFQCYLARSARAADPLAITAVTTTVAALGLAPLALATAAIGGNAVVTTDPAALLILLYLGAITMALAYGLLYAGLRTTTSATAVVATLLEPVAAMAALFLSERFAPPGSSAACSSCSPWPVQIARAQPPQEAPGSGARRRPRSRRGYWLRTFPVEDR